MDYEHLFVTGFASKTLQELLSERNQEQYILSQILTRYKKSKEGKALGLVGVTPICPVDPDSDFGKLIIGGKIAIKKCDHLDNYLRIKMKQAHYVRFERDEWISIKMFQHVNSMRELKQLTDQKLKKSKGKSAKMEATSKSTTVPRQQENVMVGAPTTAICEPLVPPLLVSFAKPGKKRKRKDRPRADAKSLTAPISQTDGFLVSYPSLHPYYPPTGTSQHTDMQPNVPSEAMLVYESLALQTQGCCGVIESDVPPVAIQPAWRPPVPPAPPAPLPPSTLRLPPLPPPPPPPPPPALTLPQALAPPSPLQHESEQTRSCVPQQSHADEQLEEGEEIVFFPELMASILR